MRLTALIFSYLFNPLLVCSYGLVLLISFLPDQFFYLSDSQVGLLFLRVFLNTFLFPLIIVFLMYKLKFVESIFLKNSKERVMPYIAVSLFYMWSYITFKQSLFPPIVYQMLLGASIALFISFFINIFVKISIHSVAMGGLLMIFLFITFNSYFDLKIPLIIIMIIVGAVGTSRLILNAHEPVEVYMGYFVGILSQIIAFRF